MGKQSPVFSVNQTLGGGPAHTLDKSTRYLPHVNTRVDRATDVDQQVNPGNRQLTGETVDLYFSNSGALCVVQKRIAFARFPVEIDTRCFVKTARSQIYSFPPRVSRESAK